MTKKILLRVEFCRLSDYSLKLTHKRLFRLKATTLCRDYFGAFPCAYPSIRTDFLRQSDPIRLPLKKPPLWVAFLNGAGCRIIRYHSPTRGCFGLKPQHYVGIVSAHFHAPIPPSELTFFVSPTRTEYH